MVFEQETFKSYHRCVIGGNKRSMFDRKWFCVLKILKFQKNEFFFQWPERKKLIDDSFFSFFLFLLLQKFRNDHAWGLVRDRGAITHKQPNVNQQLLTESSHHVQYPSNVIPAPGEKHLKELTWCKSNWARPPAPPALSSIYNEQGADCQGA